VKGGRWSLLPSLSSSGLHAAGAGGPPRAGWRRRRPGRSGWLRDVGGGREREQVEGGREGRRGARGVQGCALPSRPIQPDPKPSDRGAIGVEDLGPPSQQVGGGWPRVRGPGWAAQAARRRAGAKTVEKTDACRRAREHEPALPHAPPRPSAQLTMEEVGLARPVGADCGREGGRGG
jgi:hypothetical protein